MKWQTKMKAHDVTAQLELGFNARSRPSQPPHSASRRSCANWWFTQMRQVVEEAIEWQEATPDRTNKADFRATIR